MIKRKGYTNHPCVVHGRKFATMTEAAVSEGVSTSTLFYWMHEKRRGFRLLPYDGVMPKNNNQIQQMPHICAGGNWYYSQKDAARDLGVTQPTISYRINSPNFPDYYVHLVR